MIKLTLIIKANYQEVVETDDPKLIAEVLTKLAEHDNHPQEENARLWRENEELRSRLAAIEDNKPKPGPHLGGDTGAHPE